MLWLTVHMWVLLLGAFALGLGVGWWVWSGDETARKSDATASDTPHGTLERDFPIDPD